MKTMFFSQVTNLRNHVDHKKPEYSHLFEKSGRLQIMEGMKFQY